VRVRGAVLLLMCLAAFTACSDSKSKKKPEPPPVPVTTATVTENDIPVALQVVGRAEAYESVILKARIDGQVSAVLFTEGQHVNQGDVLIRLDPTDFATRLQQAAATTARDEALMTKSRHDTARYSALKGRNFVSEEKVNDVRTSEATASANLRASKAAEQFARLQLSYTTIRAPFSGVVGARLVFPGSAIKVNDTTLAVVNRIRPLLVSFSLPEKHLPRLRESMKSGHMKVNIILPGDNSQRFEGEVRFIDNAVDPATGTILLKATLPNDDEKLTSGQFLNVFLTLNTLTKAVTVPNEAIQQGSEGNFVFVVKNDSSVEMRKVEVVASNGGITAIKSELQNGEIVVTDGQLRLAPGVKIKAREASSPSTSQKNSSADAPAAPSSAK